MAGEYDGNCARKFRADFWASGIGALVNYTGLTGRTWEERGIPLAFWSNFLKHAPYGSPSPICLCI